MTKPKNTIPHGWKEARLVEVCSINPDSLNEKTPEKYEFKYIDLSAIEKGRLTIPKISIKFKDSPSRARRIIKQYDILFSTVRPYLLGHTMITFDAKNFICSTGFAVIRHDPKYCVYGFLYQFIFSNELNRQVEAILVGSNYPAINSSDVEKLKLPLPPLPEQKTIAQVLTNFDEGIELLTTKIDLLKQRKKGLMQKLLTGKKRLKGFGGEWKETQLKNIGIVITGSTPPTNDASNYGGKYLFVSPVDLGSSKYINESKTMLSEKGFYLSRTIPGGASLFVCIGSTIGKVGVAAKELTTNQQVNAIIPSNIDNELLYYILLYKSKHIKLLACEQAVPIINKSTFEKEKFIIPTDTFEQKAIAEILSNADTEINLQEQKLEHYKQQKKYLLNKLVTGEIRLPEFREGV